MSGNTHELQALRSVSPVFDQTRVRPRSLSGKLGSQYEDIGPEQPRLGLSLRSRLVEESWALEVLAWCFAAVTLVILIAVLAVFNRKPQRQWHSGITVNTLVNVLTTIASTALIFPVASSIAQLRWLWLRKKKQSVADFESFW